MTDDLEHQECSELLGAYVLHGVDGPEAVRVERHLDRCTRCCAELDELRAVAADLGTVVDTCPPELWERIAGQLGAEVPALRMPETVTGAGPVQPRRERRRRPGGTRRSRAAVVAGAAAVVVVGVLGLSLATTVGHVATLRSEIARRGPAVAVDAALAAPGHRTVVLQSSSGARLAELVVRRNGAGFVVSTRAPTLPGDETYQLWAIIANQPISLGLLGQQLLPGAPFSIGSSVSGAAKMMITVEPSGGVVTPDKAPVAAGTLGAP